MEIPLRIKKAALLLSLTILLLAFALKAASRTISATGDAQGQHAGTAATRGPAAITCTGASQSVSAADIPKASCYIVAPGISTLVNVGQQVGSTGAGTVALTCNGQGILRCTAKIDD
jgi:hypothetical protein